MTYWQTRRRVELLKKASGRSYVEIPQEIIRLEADLAKAKADLERFKREGAVEEQIAALATRVGDIEYRMRQMIISRKL